MPAAYSYDERDLLLRLSEGDTQAFTVLFDQYKNKIYTLAFKITGSVFLAEETVQEIFTKLWVRRRELPAILNFNAWFNTITRNHLFSLLKSQAARENREAFYAGQASDCPGADNGILLKQTEELLRKALSALPPQQNKVYYLIRMQGMKKEEVAVRLNLSQETVKSHLSKAVKNIRAYCIAHKDSVIIWLLYFSMLI
ncbi:MAG: sigma-70 family RNA polymerase sigma factor [Chitinophagaceae bacterium]|nr:sigma-70 family RNA polymerase sigma factor [Chitinophagaceae bacterium]